MVRAFEGTKDEFYMDNYLKSNLDIAKTEIKRDWDMVFVYDGSEGSGKSVKAMQDAFYCDPTLTLDRIVFVPKDFREAVMNAKKYQAVIYDEAYTGLSSRATMSLINRTLISMLAEIRQKNLFVFVVMPTFFDLDRYVAIWRSRLLIHVYTGENFQRGHFAFFNADRKKSLYILGKKFYSYGKPKANFVGKFTNHYVIDEQEYRNKKKNSLIAREKAREDKEMKAQLEDEMFERIVELPGMANVQKMEVLGLTHAQFYWKLKKYNEMQEMKKQI